MLKRQPFSVCHLSDCVAGYLSGIFTQYLNHTSWNRQLSFLRCNKLKTCCHGADGSDLGVCTVLSASLWAQLASCKRNQTLEKITVISASRSSGSLSGVIRHASNSYGMCTFDWLTCTPTEHAGRKACRWVSSVWQPNVHKLHMLKAIQVYLFAALWDLMQKMFMAWKNVSLKL